MRNPIRHLLGLLAVAALFLGLTATVDARAAEEEGIPVAVKVMDVNGNPISTAVVRHPEEEERKPVNTVTGIWQGNVLFMPDGRMVNFEAGMELTFEVSAPGYILQTVRYVVRKRKNLIEVTLQAMELEEEGEEDMPIIGFGRDKPIGGIPAEGGE